MIRLALLLALVVMPARELYPGQYAQVDPQQRQWFRSQKVPRGEHKGSLCCDEADGVYAEEDIVQGRYWARWRINGALTAWLPVPPEAVLDTANRNGSPVVWWLYKDGAPVIRCYAPGAGI